MQYMHSYMMKEFSSLIVSLVASYVAEGYCSVLGWCMEKRRTVTLLVIVHAVKAGVKIRQC